MRELLELVGDPGSARLARGALLVLLRMLPVSVLVPFLGPRGLPAPARAAVLFLLAGALLPLALGFADPSLDTGAILAMGARELVVGLVLGFTAKLPFAAFGLGGRLVDQARGASLAEVTGAGGERTSPLGELLELLGIAVFLSVGGHRLALALVSETFRIAPIGAASLSLGEDSLVGLVRLFAWSMGLGLSLAAPALVAVLLGELVLGTVGRAVPRVPTHFAGMPLRAGLGVAALLLALSRIVDEVPGAARHVFREAAALVARLAG